MVAFSKVNVMSFVGAFLVKAQMFGKFLKLMVAVTYKEHLTEHLYVWADTALPPEFRASAACPPAGHDVTSVQDSWHGLSVRVTL